MGGLGTLAAKLELQGGSQMVSGLRGVGTAAGGLKNMLSSLTGPLALLGVSFAAFKSAGNIADALKDVFAAGRELQTMSRTAGESVGNLKMLQGAFKTAGLEAGAVPDSLRLLQRALGGVNEEGQPTATVFARLGLSVQQLKGENATQQLQAIGTAINRLPDQASKAAAAMSIFGKNGSEMLALFSDPEAMGGMGKGLSEQAKLFQENAAIFSRVSAGLAALGGKVNQVFTGIAAGVAPVLMPILDKLKSVNFTSWGVQIGKAIGILAASFQDGSITELVGDALQLGGMHFVNFMSSVFVGLGRGLGAAFSLATDVLSAEFSNFPTYITALKDGLVGAVQLMGSMLLEVFQKPIVALQAGLTFAVEKGMEKLGQIPGVGRMLGLKDYHADSFDQIKGDIAANGPTFFGQSVGDLANASNDSFARSAAGFRATFDQVDFKGGLQNILSQIKAGFTEGGGVFDGSQIGQMQQKITDMIARLDKAAAAGSPAGQEQNKPGAGGSSFMTSLGKMQEGDRLARVGGFIGGGGGPALDYNRRTATATESTAKKIDTLISRVGGLNLSPQVVWS